MRLSVIGTGSSGNSYVLKSNNGKFCLLDCGLKFTTITHDKNFGSFSDLDFVWTTHVHGDHSKSLEDFKRSGCECFWWDNVEQGKVIKVGQWTLVPFPALHNAVNFGVIVHDGNENKTLAYCTDFTKIPKIEHVPYWLYEINYDEATIDTLIETRSLDELHIANNVKYHNSLEKALDYFGGLETRPKLVVACHLSKISGCADNILKEMPAVCDRIEIAKKGKTFEF